jgi:hypothetical protein
MYDFIGDIHGHADKLKQLLEKLGYTKTNGIYSHPTRKAFFLGDFIDRGPKVKEVLEIVRPMVEKNYAKAVMANHEFNLICFMVQNEKGEYLRKRSIKHIRQVLETLKELNEDELKDYTNWFMTLPLWYEETNFRVVHACWDQDQINTLKKYTINDRLDLNLLKTHYHKTTPMYQAIDVVLKGPEQKLANGKSFPDADKNPRHEVRVAWWSKETLVAGKDDIRSLVSEADITYPFYPKSEKLVFFGHYWLQGIKPYITAANAQCVDFSVAKPNGILVAYRYDNESLVDESKFVHV